jgi:CTP synthase (UTP-ammonia lyase)
MTKVAILGDFNPDSHTHKALNESIQHVADFSKIPITADWIGTDDIDIENVFGNDYNGLWIAPGSPYRNAENVIKAIKYTRERNIPTLGNCGGFQLMIVEFARNICGIENADHEETNPLAENLVITKLTCSLVRMQEDLSITDKHSLLFSIIKNDHFAGSYFCSYGINERFKQQLISGGCSFTVTSPDGQSRALELKTHPFFIGTLFQPALDSAKGFPNPIINAFLNTSTTKPI